MPRHLLNRRGVTDGVTLAVLGSACFVVGVIALVYGLSLEPPAHDFTSAAPCQTANQGTDCYNQRAIGITSVGTGRFGEVDTVDFLDDGNPHEVSLGPGLRDTSVLQSGASGSAILWHGRYTSLEVAGIDFVTDDNPVVQQRLWMVAGIIGIAFAVVLWAASLVWHRMNGRNIMPAPAPDPPST